MSPSDAILLLAYGTPATPADIAPYYAHIRGGREPSPDQVARLAARYAAIGGTSPLLTITQETARRLGERTSLQTYVGMKHWHPFIEDTVTRMHADGVRRAVAITLAPHYSRMSVGAYIKTAQGAAERAGGPRLSCVESWHLHTGLIAALAERVRDTTTRLGTPDRAHVLFTAHSLPKRIMEWGDPYVGQLVESAKAVAAAAGLRHWSFAFQSASATGEAWLGPDVLDALRDLASKDVREVVVCPIGFVADHLEVLYDLDVEAKTLAESLGMRLARTESLNAAEPFIEILAAIAREAQDGGEAR
jgi:ferrochelatase